MNELNLDDSNMVNQLTLKVLLHFNNSGKIWPSLEDAILFLQTEIGEAIELLLSKKPYKRNHPDNKELFTKERFAEELGDVIYMAIIAGNIAEVDVIQVLLKKIKGSELSIY